LVVDWLSGGVEASQALEQEGKEGGLSCLIAGAVSPRVSIRGGCGCLAALRRTKCGRCREREWEWEWEWEWAGLAAYLALSPPVHNILPLFYQVK
jgi:hypothetical protein